MKSSYDLAMERLNKQDPQAAKPVTAEQKERIAEIDRTYRAKIAEKEVMLNPKIQEAKFNGEAEVAESLQKQLRDETVTFREEMEREKEKVRNG